MNATSPRVVLITGASSGIGQACARHLHERGYRVYGSSRHAPAAVAESGGSPCMIAMDVTCEASVQAAIALIMAREGRLDVVVNNAGYGIAGAVEDTRIDEAQAQLDTNFFGVLRVCRVVLPILRAQGGGYLVNVSSIGGLIAIPFQGLYSASKFALEGLSESLRAEVRPYGVRVVMIEPGDFRTGFTAERRCVAAAEQSPYQARHRAAQAVMEADETGGASPDAIARLLERIITTPAPRLRYLAGPFMQKFTVLVLKRLLPQSWFERLIAGYYRIG